MTGNLDEAIATLLADALPGLFGGDPPDVTLFVSGEEYVVDPQSAEAMAGAPRPDDRTDDFPFNPAAPPPNFMLTQSPYPGPRRVRLTTALGDRIPLKESEVLWDEVDSRIFVLALSPTRDTTGVTGVQVLYGVTAVFTTRKADLTLNVTFLTADAAQLEQAEALALGVIELNQEALVDDSAATYTEGDYSTTVSAKNLKLIEGRTLGATMRLLVYHAEIEVKATRALRTDEGAAIERIRTTARPLDPARSIDIHIDVDA